MKNILRFILAIVLTYLILMAATAIVEAKQPSYLLSPLQKTDTQSATLNQTSGGYTSRQKSAPLTPRVLKNIIYKLFGTDGNTAVALAYAESGFRCEAISPLNYNGTHDHGLFQINDVHLPKFGQKSPQDCIENIKVAYQIYKVSGFTAWSAFNNGRYKKFL